MVSENFRDGDLVWAKMKGFSYWPAKITEPTDEQLNYRPKHKKCHYVFFFGTDNYAWIQDENIQAHSSSLLDTFGKRKIPSLQKAISAFCDYCKTHKIIEKTVSPKTKQEKTESNAKSSQTKVVKVLNNISKKHQRKVIPIKSSVKRAKKRPFDSMNGATSECTYPKSRKVEMHKHPLVGSTPPTIGNSDISGTAIYEGSSSPFFDRYSREHDSEKRIKNGKHVLPSKKKFGFIGLGLMGAAIVNNLIDSGHNITVWNKSLRKCDPLAEKGIKVAHSPAELVAACDITFCCVSDPVASKSLIFGDRGVLKGLEQAEKMGGRTKGYVEMTSIDPETSQEIAEAIVMKCGRYLEAPVCGNSADANDGALLILASGDRQLFLDCETCFHAMGKHAYYISCDVGSGSKMSLLLSMVSGTLCAAVAEAIVLAERLDLPGTEFADILSEGPLHCKSILQKCKMMIDRNFKPITPLKHMQKDMNLALMIGNYFSQPMPVTAAANEVYKHARLLKYSDNDVSAVYQGVRY